MSHTAWPTIADVSVIASAMGVTLNVTAQSQEFQNTILDSVINNIATKTRRQFLVTTESRYYDGNDTGELEIDEFITLNSIEIIGWWGITSGLTISNPIAVNRAQFPNTRIQVYRGSIPALYRVWIDRFVQGRGNILVNAAWGYGTTIPSDLWLGAAYQATGILLNMRQYNEDGYLIKWSEEDVTQVRNRMDPFKFFDSGMTWKGLLTSYRKPSSYFIRKQTRSLQ